MIRIENTPGKRVANDATDLALRASMFRLLSLSFGYPSASTFSLLRNTVLTLRSIESRMTRRTTESFQKIVSDLAEFDLATWEDEYIRVFTHIVTTDCNPCETSYTSKNIFQAAQQLANIKGMYEAFGLVSSLERPDHIAVECEFVSFLCLRESFERWSDQNFEADEMRDARSLFLSQHLGRWSGAFTRVLVWRAGHGPFVSLADFLAVAVRRECVRLKLRVPSRSVQLKSVPLALSDRSSPLDHAHRNADEVVFNEEYDDEE